MAAEWYAPAAMVASFAPSAALAPWVECFWSRDAACSGAVIEHSVLPDGAADIIVEVASAEARAVGTMTVPLVLRGVEMPELLGVRFRPGRALPFLGVPLSEVTDMAVPLAALGDTAHAIAGARTLPERIAAFEGSLIRLAARADGIDRRVEGAVARIVATEGRVAIDALADGIGISRQHLARQFLSCVGVPPKTFARVIRFRALLRRAARTPGRDWAALAADGGYFDQSHLIADFQQFAGTTPVPFFLSGSNSER